MLGEHAANEDAKGFYSLKQIIQIYAPEFYGYEEILHKRKGPEYSLRRVHEFEIFVKDNGLASDRLQAIRDSYAGWLTEYLNFNPDMTPDSVPNRPDSTVGQTWEEIKKSAAKQRKTAVAIINSIDDNPA